MDSPDRGANLAGRKLVQVALTTRDVERARHFYREILGFPLLFEAGGMLFFDLGGLRLLIGPEGAAGPPGGSILYFDAPDLDRLAAALEARGVEFLGPAQTVQRTTTGELKVRAFRDPDGNTLELMGMIPH